MKTRPVVDCGSEPEFLIEKFRLRLFQKNSIETCILSRVKQIPAQVGCMRQVLGPGALGRPSGIGWSGRWEGGSG